MTYSETRTFPLGLAVELTEGWNDATEMPTMRGTVVVTGQFGHPFELFSCELDVVYISGNELDIVREVLERWQEAMQ